MVLRALVSFSHGMNILFSRFKFLSKQFHFLSKRTKIDKFTLCILAMKEFLIIFDWEKQAKYQRTCLKFFKYLKMTKTPLFL